MSTPADYYERVYAGVLGKMIGVYLGRPFEGWSYEKITAELGEIDRYVHERLGLPLIVTDDDLTGTFTFIRALEDHQSGRAITPALVDPTAGEILTTQKLTFSWEAAEGATSYTITISTYANLSSPLLTATTQNLSFTSTWLLPKNKMLYWSVKAKGPNGPSPRGEIRSFKIRY